MTLKDSKAKNTKEYIEALPDDTLFVMQREGYVGNAMIWQPNTCDITKATRYTKSQILMELPYLDKGNVIWTASYIEGKQTTIIDMQYVDRKFSLK